MKTSGLVGERGYLAINNVKTVMNEKLYEETTTRAL
jgi:hypothetical protein